jgi:uncharacterized protein YaeQ
MIKRSFMSIYLAKSCLETFVTLRVPGPEIDPAIIFPDGGLPDQPSSVPAYNPPLDFPKASTMALRATIYKADLQIADMDRHYYADHTLTLARHPSETDERMMVRVLVYALAAEEGIAFTRGLSEVSEPEIWVRDLSGEIRLWIDLGQPDETRIRKACSRADQVWVVCYGSACDVWWKQIADKLGRHGNLTVFQVPAETSRELAALATRSMRLQCMVQDGEITLSSDEGSVAVRLTRLRQPA